MHQLEYLKTTLTQSKVLVNIVSCGGGLDLIREIQNQPFFLEATTISTGNFVSLSNHTSIIPELGQEFNNPLTAVYMAKKPAARIHDLKHTMEFIRQKKLKQTGKSKYKKKLSHYDPITISIMSNVLDMPTDKPFCHWAFADRPSANEMITVRFNSDNRTSLELDEIITKISLFGLLRFANVKTENPNKIIHNMLGDNDEIE